MRGVNIVDEFLTPVPLDRPRGGMACAGCRRRLAGEEWGLPDLDESALVTPRLLCGGGKRVYLV
jgi:hypothetical protein